MKGGSRYGAGRPGWRRKCEQSQALDIRQLHRRKLLYPGAGFSWKWTNNYGEPVGSVNIWVHEHQVTLSYQWTPRGSDPQSVICPIQIARTACTYGGNRSWFLCPRCWRRCAVVYFGAPGGHYSCRRCLRLGYMSEAEGAMDRLWRKQRKLEKRLGEDYEKPKGMHWRTYERMTEQISDIEEEKDGLFVVYAARLLGMVG